MSPVLPGFLSRRTLSLAVAVASFSTFASGQVLAQVEEIIVTADGSQVMLPDAYAGDQVARGGRAGMLGNLDFMDSPFASTNFTEALMKNQQTISVGDVLQNEPTVRVAKGFGNFQELYMIRGFPVFSDDMTYNGVFGILPRQFVSTEFLERVEVFRGASAFLNGAAPGGSSLGGTVNLVPKRATEEPMTRVTAGLEGSSHGYLAFDSGRRFGNDNNHGLRVNVARRDGEMPVEDQDRELSVLGLNYDYNGEGLRLTADVGYQQHRIDAPRPAIRPNDDPSTPGADFPETPEADSNFTQPWTYTDEKQLFAAFRGEYDFNDSITAWLGGGFRDGEEENVLANPRSSATGVTSASRFDNVREDDITSFDAGIRGRLETGNIAHGLSLSGSVISIESANAFNFYGSFANNLYAPSFAAPPVNITTPGGDLGNPLLTAESENRSIALADMMTMLDDALIITLGVRLQDMETRSFDGITGSPTSRYEDDQLTPLLGVVYKPTEQVSLYANYIEALLPGEIAPANSGGAPVQNVGEVLAPYETEQMEIGVKYDGGNFGGSLSAYSSDKPSAYVENAIFGLYGEQRNRGVELSLFGSPLEGVRLIGGLTLLDSEMTSTAGGINEGKDALGAPDTQVNLNAEWDVPAVAGLTLDARAVYTASQYIDAANTGKVDSWTRFDLGARYSTTIAGQSLTIRARVQNLADSNDWISVGGFPGSNYLVLGTPRTFMLSATVEF